MRLSELVRCLQALQAIHGDLPVRVVDGEGAYAFLPHISHDEDMGAVVYIDTTADAETNPV